MKLNHYAINQIVKGRMVPASAKMRFGRIGLLNVAGQMLKHRPRERAKVSFSYETDTIAVDAFAKVHGGVSPETVLIDSDLVSRFHAEARKRGFHASAADLNRRLINVRKNKARYNAHGIYLPKTTVSDPQPSIVWKYAHVIEFSLSRLHSRYGVSIDDILIDPDLAAEYEKMAQVAAPDLTSYQLRLAALYIRKSRFIPKKAETIIRTLKPEKIEAKFGDVGTLARIKLPIPDDTGLIEVLEDGRHLYITRNENLQQAVEQLASPASLKFMGNAFWEPDPSRINIRIFLGEQFLKVPISQWQLKLIAARQPVFNWPIAA
jgi:hypothetical protein